MKLKLAALLSTTVLAFSACGSDESSSQGQQQGGGGQPPAGGQPPGGGQQPGGGQPQAQQPGQPGGEQLSTEQLIRESEAIAGTVAEAARRLSQNPQADVSEELARVQERARQLAGQARQPLQEGRQQAEEALQQGREQLSPQQRREARERLAQLNERTAQAAERLRRVVDPEDAVRVARQEAERLRQELGITLEDLRGVAPSDVRNRIEQLRDRLGGLAP